MDKEQLHHLLLQYVNHTIDREDYIELIDFVKDAKEETAVNAIMHQVWETERMTPAFTTEESERLYQQITADPRFKAKNTTIEQSLGKTKPGIYKIWKIAAAAVLLIGMSAAFYFYWDHQVDRKDKFARHDLPPGGNKAILTLSNGRQITLTNATDGKLAEQGGVIITKTADGQLVYTIAGNAKDLKAKQIAGQYNTIATPMGGQYQVNLPDGTKAWLNAASTLKFPAVFALTGQRGVELSGEAYFEVAHDQDRPFVVKTNRQEVTVLGTHFNINSYTNEPLAKTTLLEGRVRVQPLAGLEKSNEDVVLKPGQEAALGTGNRVNVKNADLEAVMAWKNGKFIYNDEDLYGIMRKIARWYDVEIKYEGDFSGKTFVGSISRFSTVAEVLRKFELTGNVHFKIEGRRITVMP